MVTVAANQARVGSVRALLAFLRHGLIPIADQAVISGGNFASGVILARALTVPEFGLFVVANLVILTAVAIQNGLLLQPLVVNGAGLEDRAFRGFLRANLALQAGFIGLSAVLVAATALVWEPLRPLALPLTLAAALAQAQEFCRRALYTRSQMPAAIANNAVSYVLQALLLGAVGWRLGLDLDQALWIVALTSLLAVLLGYVQLRRFATTERDSLREVARQSFRIGKWAAASAALATVTVQAFPIIITALAGLPTTAQFGVIRQVLGPLHLLLHPLESYYLPRAARGLDRAGTPGLGRVLRQASFVMAPPFLIYSVVVAIAPGFLLRAVYGDKYIAVADVLRLFALVTMTSLPIAILSLEVGARRLQRYLFVAEGWAAAAIYGVGLYLIAQLGLVGVAITTALAASGQIALFAAVIGRARGAATQAGRSGV